MERVRACLRAKGVYPCAMAALFLLLCFVTFFRLDVGASEKDEARHGISAYEMIQTGDALVTTYEYAPDDWNLKPMLSEYPIVLSYKIFGYNLWGLRFPSAFFWVVLALLYSRFARRQYGRIAAAAVLLLFSGAYRPYMWHAARCGNADSLHLFFSGVSLLLLLKYDGKKPGNLCLACLCFALDFLTKSWHAGVLALQIILFVLLYEKKLFKSPLRVLLCLVSALAPVLLWGILRYRRDGGTQFFVDMFTTDVLTRGTTVLEEREGGPLFYLWRIVSDTLCMGAATACAADAYLNKKRLLKDRAFVLMLLFVAIPPLLYSFAVSKLMWYTYTVYPAFILLGARSLQSLLSAPLRPKQKAAFAALPGALILSAVVVSLVYVGALTLKEVKPDTAVQVEVQAELDSLRESLGQYRGQTLYRLTPEGKKSKNIHVLTDDELEQREVLFFEWAADLKPMHGGQDAWLADESGLLFAETSDLPALDALGAPYEALHRAETFTVLKHPGQ